MDERRRFGNQGEEEAARFLASLGYDILDTQWRSPFGEIDLVCLDRTEGEVVFVEVKTRQSLGSGYPEDSVTPQKLRHLEASAECFLEERNWSERLYRFDVIAISTLPGEQYNLVHLKGV
ncbi:MAG: YraN family protein [Patescibacteria group bacterium]